MTYHSQKPPSTKSDLRVLDIIEQTDDINPGDNAFQILKKSTLFRNILKEFEENIESQRSAFEKNLKKQKIKTIGTL